MPSLSSFVYSPSSSLVYKPFLSLSSWPPLLSIGRLSIIINSLLFLHYRLFLPAPCRIPSSPHSASYPTPSHCPNPSYSSETPALPIRQSFLRPSSLAALPILPNKLYPTPPFSVFAERQTSLNPSGTTRWHPSSLNSAELNTIFSSKTIQYNLVKLTRVGTQFKCSG